MSRIFATYVVVLMVGSLFVAGCPPNGGSDTELPDTSIDTARETAMDGTDTPSDTMDVPPEDATDGGDTGPRDADTADGFQDTDGKFPPCVDNDDCPNPLICREGTCRYPPVDAADSGD